MQGVYYLTVYSAAGAGAKLRLPGSCPAAGVFFYSYSDSEAILFLACGKVCIIME